MTMKTSSSVDRKRACAALEPQTCSAGKRRCRVPKSVRFPAQEVTRHTVVNHFDGCLGSAEEEKLRSALWYSQKDFSTFLEDRTQSIRVWRAVGGNSSLMEPAYCLRGLETFQQMLLNNEMQTLRTQHVSAVLAAQKASAATANPEERIAQASRNCTFWAVDRAIRFGVKDAVEAQSYQLQQQQQPNQEHNHTCFPASKTGRAPCVSAFSLRQMLPTKLTSASEASRQSLAQMGAFSFAQKSSGTSGVNNVMDLMRLKQLNMQFLQCLSQSGNKDNSYCNFGWTTTTTSPSSSSTVAGTLDLLNEALQATSDV